MSQKLHNNRSNTFITANSSSPSSQHFRAATLLSNNQFQQQQIQQIQQIQHPNFFHQTLFSQTNQRLLRKRQHFSPNQPQIAQQQVQPDQDPDAESFIVEDNEEIEDISQSSNNNNNVDMDFSFNPKRELFSASLFLSSSSMMLDVTDEDADACNNISFFDDDIDEEFLRSMMMMSKHSANPSNGNKKFMVPAPGTGWPVLSVNQPAPHSREKKSYIHMNSPMSLDKGAWTRRSPMPYYAIGRAPADAQFELPALPDAGLISNPTTPMSATSTASTAFRAPAVKRPSSQQSITRRQILNKQKIWDSGKPDVAAGFAPCRLKKVVKLERTERDRMEDLMKVDHGRGILGDIRPSSVPPGNEITASEFQRYWALSRPSTSVDDANKVRPSLQEELSALHKANSFNLKNNKMPTMSNRGGGRTGEAGYTMEDLEQKISALKNAAAQWLDQHKDDVRLSSKWPEKTDEKANNAHENNEVLELEHPDESIEILNSVESNLASVSSTSSHHSANFEALAQTSPMASPKHHNPVPYSEPIVDSYTAKTVINVDMDNEGEALRDLFASNTSKRLLVDLSDSARSSPRDVHSPSRTKLVSVNIPSVSPRADQLEKDPFDSSDDDDFDHSANGDEDEHIIMKL